MTPTAAARALLDAFVKDVVYFNLCPDDLGRRLTDELLHRMAAHAIEDAEARGFARAAQAAHHWGASDIEGASISVNEFVRLYGSDSLPEAILKLEDKP